jgi:uncharacterized protein (UPF0218 family)
VTEAVVELQPTLRLELKEPLGPLCTDTEELLAAAGTPLVTVGDIVTYHLLEAGRVPDVALIDERTERSAVDRDVRDAIGGFDREVGVQNPPATLTAELLEGLREAVAMADEETTLVVVEGEEDLAALPAIVLAPEETSVVYGQPGEGMVHVTVDRTTSERARDILDRMDGDARRLWTMLGTDG